MTQDNRVRVAGLGEILWDLLPDGKQLGGATTNFAWRAQAGGAASEIVSCVGDDDLGREIRDRLDAWGLGRSHMATDPDHPTGTVSVTLEGDGVPHYVIHEDVAWDYTPWTDSLGALAREVAAVCFGTLGQRAPVSRRTIRRFIDSTRPDALRVYDVNLRPTGDSVDIVRDSLSLSNVLKLNDAELPRIADMVGLEGSERETLSALVERYGLRLAALTRGPAGSLLVSPSAVSDHPGCPVRVVDTIGAGDAFTAAMVMALLDGESLDTINDRANHAAAKACSHPGGIPDFSGAG